MNDIKCQSCGYRTYLPNYGIVCCFAVKDETKGASHRRGCPGGELCTRYKMSDDPFPFREEEEKRDRV